MNKDNLLNLFNSTVDKLVKTNRQFSRKKNSSLKKEIMQDRMQFHSDKLDERFNEISSKSNHNNNNQGKFLKIYREIY